MPADFRVSITNPAGKDAYPIAGFTYLLVHEDAKDKAKGTAIVDFLAGPSRWAEPWPPRSIRAAAEAGRRRR